jgi:hypothetical protein
MQRETTSRADWYRGRAADCLAWTEHAPTVSVKAMLADMAARWLRLAELVHKWDGGDDSDHPSEQRRAMPRSPSVSIVQRKPPGRW